MEKGREEGVVNERNEIAIKCLKNGIDTETISKITGLSVKDINKIQL
jgi:predicted transposase/invertase (TIGR01784 family)